MHPSEELWISRALDRRATEQDWRGLEAIAARDGDVWRRLATTLRVEAALVRGVDAVLPTREEVLAAPPSRMRGPLGALAALLLLAVVFVLGRASAPEAARSPTVAAPAADVAGDADRLLDTYLAVGRESGRVLEQLPLSIVASRRSSSGPGFEVVFVRSFVERTEVDHAMTLAPDEIGRPMPLAVDLAHFVPPANY